MWTARNRTLCVCSWIPTRRKRVEPSRYYILGKKEQQEGERIFICMSLESQKGKHLLDTSSSKSLQSCPTLCDPIDGSPPGSPIPGILQAKALEWVAISFSNAWKWKVKSEVVQLCPTLHDPMDCSPPGSSAHGIFQARVLNSY